MDILTKMTECYNGPKATKTRSVPDLEINNEKMYRTVKNSLNDSQIISELTQNERAIPHILGDSIHRFFAGNPQYEEILGDKIGEAVYSKMTAELSNLYKSVQPKQKGGDCSKENVEDDDADDVNAESNPPPEEQAKTDLANEWAKDIEYALSIDSANAYSMYTVNADNLSLIDKITGSYISSGRPDSKRVAQWIRDKQVNQIMQNKVDQYLQPTMRGGGLLDTALNAAQTAVPGIDMATSNIPGMPNLGPAFAYKPNAGPLVSNPKILQIGPKAKKAKETCEKKSAVVSDHFPSTYDKNAVFEKAITYAEKKVNGVLCKNSEEIERVLTSVLKYNFYQYLNKENAKLVEYAKMTFLSCIKIFCANLTEETKYKMIYKYIFGATNHYNQVFQELNKGVWDKSVFLKAFPPTDNTPFSYALVSRPAKPSPLLEINNKRLVNVPKNFEAKFDPVKFQGDNLLGQMVGIGYGATKVFPNVVYENLRDSFAEAASKTETLKEIFGIFDDAVFQTMDIILGQLNRQNIVDTMCRYLILESPVSEILGNSTGMVSSVLTHNQKISSQELPHAAMFFLYHTIQHRINPSLKQKDLRSLYESYDKVKKPPSNTKMSNAILDILRVKTGDLYLKPLMELANKPFSPYNIFARIFGRGGGLRTRRKRNTGHKRDKKKSRRLPR